MRYNAGFKKKQQQKFLSAHNIMPCVLITEEIDQLYWNVS